MAIYHGGRGEEGFFRRLPFVRWCSGRGGGGGRSQVTWTACRREIKRERERRPAWRNRTKVCQSILSLSFSLSFLPEEISPFSSSLRAKKVTNHQGTEERTREKFSRRSPSRELFSRVCTMSWRPRPGPPCADKVARRASLFALHTIFAE